MIRKLALKPVDNSLNISLNCNITRQESQITIIEQENTYLIPPIEVLEKSPKELEYYLKDLEQYADDLEQYADDLEHYYLEELQKQIDEKDDDIRKLTSHINLILEDEYLKDLQKEISEKDARITKLKSKNNTYITIIESLEDDIYEQESKLKVIKSCPRDWL
ncbi:hypothetical protein H6F47_24595 [Sphaerospermopsis sp. FACHB-1094]|uniref:hypothetical protein n=1 Tax=Sphaerospermopsis sp. FACHB-1094 TaxID=2692861 RepID=UPI001684549E|nr:hypothetical protein [Sphaerospermopsis sp. FACHB-1094]MBD2135508.1 hypothetical protein [Sphaerospermopsis sp. FACHB-1094]